MVFLCGIYCILVCLMVILNVLLFLLESNFFEQGAILLTQSSALHIWVLVVWQAQVSFIQLYICIYRFMNIWIIFVILNPRVQAKQRAIFICKLRWSDPYAYHWALLCFRSLHLAFYCEKFQTLGIIQCTPIYSSLRFYNYHFILFALSHIYFFIRQLIHFIFWCLVKYIADLIILHS